MDGCLTWLSFSMCLDQLSWSKKMLRIDKIHQRGFSYAIQEDLMIHVEVQLKLGKYCGHNSLV